MKQNNKTSRRIHILREDVFKKIAAGEVIDRPFSVVRELLDNSLDAESSEISLFIEQGGISRIRVIDDGFGMSQEDIKICFLAHSTSKITEENDLYNIHTLGFRGEALSSIGTCSLLHITSMQEAADHAHKLLVKAGRLESSGPCQGKKGTIVDVSNLFYNMPARKQFLKSTSAETNMCRSIFVDKALPFPDICFRYFINNKLKLYFEKQDNIMRVVSGYSNLLHASQLHDIETHGHGFKANIVLGGPDLLRRDKKLIQVFVNKRRIFEYSLCQAVEYAFSGYMPGGNFPVAFIFLEITPDLVDFNIHPAKKEARIKNLSYIHKSLVACIKNFLTSFNISMPCSLPNEKNTVLTGLEHVFTKEPFIYSEKSHKQETLPAQENLSSHKPFPYKYKVPSKSHAQEEHITIGESIPSSPSNSDQVRYLGQVFHLFLIAEWKDNLFIIDQHAAHEKLLFESFMRREKSAQELLIPISFDVSEIEKETLTKRQKELYKLGITLEKTGNSSFEIISLPIDFLRIGEGALVAFLKNCNKSFEELKYNLNSMAACKLAIKDGDSIDNATALELIQSVFKLENARCPHGRPIWYKINRKDLFHLLGRS